MLTRSQVGPGDNFTVTIGGFDAALSTLGDSLTGASGAHSVTHINGKKFSAK